MTSPAQIDEIIEEPMDDRELRMCLGKGVKILRYKDLNRYSSMKQLLPKKNDACMILYENAPRDGHWCAITRNHGKIHFFDPYGEKPDRQLKYTNYSRQNVTQGGEQSLSNLLTTANCPIEYNEIPYQRESSDVNTCGRHCVCWIKESLHGGTLEGYYKKMLNYKRLHKMNPDEVVAALVPIDLPK